MIYKSRDFNQSGLERVANQESYIDLFHNDVMGDMIGKKIVSIKCVRTQLDCLYAPGQLFHLEVEAQ